MVNWKSFDTMRKESLLKSESEESLHLEFPSNAVTDWKKGKDMTRCGGDDIASDLDSLL